MTDAHSNERRYLIVDEDEEEDDESEEEDDESEEDSDESDESDDEETEGSDSSPVRKRRRLRRCYLRRVGGHCSI